MRLNLIAGILLFIGTSLTAQVQFGVKTFYGTSYGNNTAKEYINLAPLQVHNISTKGAEAKKGIGLSLYADNSKLFFMSDVQYATSGRNFTLESTNYSRTPLDPAVVYKTLESDVRLAVTSGVRYKNFKFGVGPEFSLAVNRYEELSGISQISSSDEAMKTGFNFLVGYEFMNHLHIDLKHTYMFNDVASEFFYNGTPMDMKSNLKYLELSLGLYF